MGGNHQNANVDYQNAISYPLITEIQTQEARIILAITRWAREPRIRRIPGVLQGTHIITLCLPAHSSHLTQPLDVGCFALLKKAYGRQIETFIKAHINYTTKVEFFLAFKRAYLQSVSVQNARAGFYGAGLAPFNPEAVLSKLDVRLQTPTPTTPPSDDVELWVSQTPHNPTDALVANDSSKESNC
jgi:hypothetical protein